MATRHGKPRRGDLTPREMEVLRLLAEGLNDRQIAERMVISAMTVNTHTRAIFETLGVHTRTAAVVRALERGIIGFPREADGHAQ